MPVTLDEILARTRSELPEVRARRSELEREAQATPPPPSLREALRREFVAVIAEVKRRSPSAGTLRSDLDAAETAALYAGSGAAAVSVLTDRPYFGGSLMDLWAAAVAVPVPVLRKDFILDEVQILEARAAGAAGVLLIVRALPFDRLRSLLRFSLETGLDALVEVHAEAELDHALSAGAAVIGVNSRDLDSFRIDTAAAWALLRRVPADRITVAESGMATPDDVAAAAAAGADAVLVGSALSMARSPGALLRRMAGVPRRGR